MRLAIVIEGNQNSGKTSTIKALINNFGSKSISQMRKGWQRLFLNKSFQYLRLDIYCVPASPSETNFPLSKRFPNWIPEVLIVAVQPNGQHYKNSYTFLNVNNYNILTFKISNIDGPSDWEKFNKSNQKVKLTNRANTIIDSIRNSINSQRII